MKTQARSSLPSAQRRNLSSYVALTTLICACMASSVLAQQNSYGTPAAKRTSALPYGQTVPDLPGYVRTPFTNPPRLVDVRGMEPGSKVVCPYTQNPFLLPAMDMPAPASIRITTAPRKTQTADVSASRNVTRTIPESSPAPAYLPAPDLPYGSAIAGRPGFVNSPYAAKHQLVDVTGLPVGMEVKCPYSGRLFRVPPQ